MTKILRHVPRDTTKRPWPAIPWIACRDKDWPGASSPLKLPEVQRGIRGLLFGIGADGAAWLARLEASETFADRRPRPEDLAPGDEPRGAFQPGARADPALWSSAYWAAIAITMPQVGSAADQGAVLDLVRALRSRRDPGHRALCVVVTLDSSAPETDAFVAELCGAGAFVVRPSPGAGGDHLHHLPLRSLSGEPRLACVDLLDTLLLWAPGQKAWLHLIPSDPDQAVAALDRITSLTGRAQGLDFRIHLDPYSFEGTVDDMARLAELCAAHCLGPDGDMIVSSAQRQDGLDGTADLLVIG